MKDLPQELALPPEPETPEWVEHYSSVGYFDLSTRNEGRKERRIDYPKVSMASQSPEGAQKTQNIKVEEIYQKMLLVTFIHRKPHIGTQADAENFTDDLERVVYVFKNVPTPTRRKSIVPKGKSVSIGPYVQPRR